MDLDYSINGEESRFIYIKNILSANDLEILETWLQNKSFISGKCISGKEIPRKQLWYHNEGKYFCDTWKVKYDRWKSQKYDNFLLEIQKKINTIVNEKLNNNVFFNSCLINYYRNGENTIKPHRDTPDSFGVYPIIANYSYGTTRKMLIKKIDYNPDNLNSLKHDKNDHMNIDINLEHNSLLIMSGASQKYFTHEIPVSNTNLSRVSFTFRKHIS
jgi:alkylated DNA repair dioxygenase AlkB